MTHTCPAPSVCSNPLNSPPASSASRTAGAPQGRCGGAGAWNLGTASWSPIRPHSNPRFFRGIERSRPASAPSSSLGQLTWLAGLSPPVEDTAPEHGLSCGFAARTARQVLLGVHRSPGLSDGARVSAHGTAGRACDGPELCPDGDRPCPLLHEAQLASWGLWDLGGCGLGFCRLGEMAVSGSLLVRDMKLVWGKADMTPLWHHHELPGPLPQTATH